MRASLKFREDQKPLFRAKVPLSILGFPFQSGISTGDSKELCLNLSTFFEPGPSLKLAYHPNDSWNSFSLVVKTGIKHFGSPICSPITMSAEFNLNSGGNPRFFLQFKPHIGDFAIKKTAGSSISFQPQSSDFDPKIESNAKDHDSDTGGSVDGGQTPLQNGAYRSEKDIFSGQKINRFSTETHAAGAIGNLFSGMEINATTIFPVRNVAVLKFRWGIKSPPEIKSAFIRNPTAQISLRKVPVLVMDKIAIEHVADNTKRNPAGLFPGRNADMAEACFTINRQLETMQAENGLLRKAVEELRSENAGEKPVTFAGTQDWETERSGGKALGGGNGGRNSSETSGIAGKMTGCAVNEELKKAH